jgi:hypothetical protein
MPIDPRRIAVIDDKTAEILRGMSPARKLEMANVMYVQAGEMIACMIRSTRPNLAESEVRAEVRKRMSRGAA